MVQKLLCAGVIVSIALLVGCQTHRHVVGDGPQEWQSTSERQWYILWGLVPINEVQSAPMAGDAEDYEIKTETTFLDGVISIVTAIITVNSRTVTVTK